jgi:hypothetical protein
VVNLEMTKPVEFFLITKSSWSEELEDRSPLVAQSPVLILEISKSTRFACPIKPYFIIIAYRIDKIF